MKLTADRLRAMTLARQFPAIRGRGSRQLLDLLDRLGPIQSQVPRAPFLTAASRLPGIDYHTINSAFAEHQLLKTTNLRGTVHTTAVDQFAAVDAARRPPHSRDLGRVLGIDQRTTAEVIMAIETFCADEWQPRPSIVEHVRSLLTSHPSARSDELERGFGQNLVWGHSGLIRRPRDDHWELRTDTFHRTARRVVDRIETVDHETAIVRLARVHLASYGPANRRDIAWWLGSSLGAVDQALATLEPELVHHTGPDGDDLIDLASLPDRRLPDPGLRLLPEFDGLLLGYAPADRGRFIDLDHLGHVWARANGLFSPTVLVDGRIVGTWRTHGSAKATVAEINPFVPGAVDADAVAEAIGHVAQALQLTITDIRLRATTS